MVLSPAVSADAERGGYCAETLGLGVLGTEQDGWVLVPGVRGRQRRASRQAPLSLCAWLQLLPGCAALMSLRPRARSGSVYN